MLEFLSLSIATIIASYCAVQSAVNQGSMSTSSWSYKIATFAFNSLKFCFGMFLLMCSLLLLWVIALL